MMCPNCGTENQPDRRFCRECGFPLPVACPRCGAPNDPSDKFCGECGAALHDVAEAPAAAKPDRDPHERRFVAVLFADLVGFTDFSEARDPEIVRATLTTYFDRARNAITRYGGEVEKFIGDAVMAVWGATVAHEDDSERAVRAGLELVSIVESMNEELNDGELAVRVGVLCGEASVAPASPEQGFVVGDLVNTAARLQSIAAPGTVVVGEPAYRMLRDVVEFEPLGERALKGKSEPVAVWRAVRVRADRSSTEPGGVVPAFVDREEELRLLTDALHATERSGRARLVSIVGEAGIGKSRLASELRDYIAGLGENVFVHHGRSPAYDQNLTLWALGEMVRQRAGIAETDDPLRSRTRLRTAVAEYLPVPADQEWVERRLAALLGLEEAPTGERGEFFAAVRTFFHSIAGRGTTVLVFEDFHWADAGLIEFVRELVELSPRHPILVITLARPDLLERAPGWGAGRRNFTSAHLGPLSDDDMAELVTGMVEGIAENLVAEITKRANGIPLYAVELVRMLIADGDLVMGATCCVPTRDLSAIRVPDTVRAVIEARLDRLPPDVRAMLQDAAVLGTSFTRTGLGAMSGREEPQLDDVLDALVRQELLQFESDARSPERGQFRFVQSMIREVAYGRLTREERRTRHRRAAEFFAARGELELAAAVADHYMAAYGVTDDAEGAQALAASATTALSDAAERAAGLHSHAQALAMVEQALTLATDPREKAALLQRASRSATELARHELAITDANEALAWYRDHGSEQEVTDAAALVGMVLCNAFKATEAIEVLEPIVTAGAAFDEPALVAAGSVLARAYLMALRDEDAAALCDRIIGPAERLELIPTIVNTLITRGTALGNLGRLHEAIALLQGATRYAQDHDLPLEEMRAANNVGHLLAADDHVGAMEACRTGMDQANRLGDVRFLDAFTWAVAAYLDRDGRFDEAQALRDEIRDRIELPSNSLVWYQIADLTAQIARGDASAIDPAYDAVRRAIAVDDPQAQAGVPVARGKLNVLTGRFEAAYDDVMDVEAAIRSPDHLAIAVTAAALLGDAARLEAVADALSASRVRGRMLGELHGAVSGSLAALHGGVDEAVAGFTQALGFDFLAIDRAGMQALFATLVGRDVPEASRASEAALETFTETGAVAYLDVYRDGMPPSVTQRAAGD